MSLLSVMPMVKDYNADKPSMFDPTVQRTLYEEDYKRIKAITEAVALLSLPFTVQIIVRGQCKQLYLRCVNVPKEGPDDMKKSVSLPNIHQKAKE